MPNLRCPTCGKTVRLAGVAALCPYCGQLVSAQPLPTEQVQPQPVEPIHSDEPDYVAEPLPREFLQRKPNYKLYYLVGALAAGLVLLLAVVAILVNKVQRLTSAPPLVVAPTPPPKPVTPPDDPNKGSEWFKESPIAPKPQPAPAPAPATKPVAPPPPHAQLAGLKPSPPQQLARFVNDEQIGIGLSRGIEYLLSQFANSRLKDASSSDSEMDQGRNALAIYALLHCGYSLSDSRLTRDTDLVKGMLDRLKEYPMSGDKATYSRSLRISALTVYNRPQDKAAIEADVAWLIKSSKQGAYDYSMPKPEEKRDNSRWDNSNSQYGALGLWAAAEAGFKIPTNYWQDVESHWQSCQLPSGGWAYSGGDNNATTAMTCAGTTMLFVARDQIAANNTPSNTYVPLTKFQQRAIDWFAEGNRVLQVDSGHRGYTLYGLERVGLASGYKYLGTHDWYVELAAMLLNEQKKDGSWEGGDGTVAETAFALLFLSRGRNPVFVNKLKFDGAWSNRPRDVEVLTRFASKQLEKQLNWEIADIGRDWWSWFDSPLLYITSDRALAFKEDQIKKLREFALAGGLIFTHAERDNEAFNTSVDELAAQLFPGMPFEQIDPGHPIYTTVYGQTGKPLKGVSNGVRLLIVHSPQDLARWWQPTPTKSQRVHSEVAINIAIYAAGRRDLRNRIASPFVAEPGTQPIASVPFARLQYDGNWDPEPSAWKRASNVLQTNTGIALQLTQTKLANLKYEVAPIAHLTGTGELNLSDEDADALRVFVTHGGVLIIDACGGSKAFANSVQQKLLPKLFADTRATALQTDAPPLRGDEGELKDLKDLSKPRLRPELPDPTAATILTVRAGKGQILFLRLDLTNGLLGTNTVGIAGYQPGWCEDFVQNVVLWTLSRLPKS
jgi:hypothetical protein